MSVVKITDVDDYITPSQACINPLFASSKTKKSTTSTSSPEEIGGRKITNSNGIVSSTNPRRRRRKRTPLIISEPQISQEREGQRGGGGGLGVARVNVNSSSVLQGVKPNVVKVASNVETTKERKDEVVMEQIPSSRLNAIKKQSPSVNLSYDIDQNNVTFQHQEPLHLSTLKNNTENHSANMNSSSEKKKATVSVADCLACSGCITSSEAVLVTTQHSIDTLIKNCSPSSSTSSKKKVVFTISPAAIADIIRVLNPESSFVAATTSSSQKDGKKATCNQEAMIQSTYQMLTSYLHDQFNASIVLNGYIPQKISLLQSAIEFCTRYQYIHSPKQQQQQQQQQQQTHNYESRTKLNHQNFAIIKNDNKHSDYLSTKIQNLTTPSIALCATSTRYLLNANNNETKTEGIEIQHTTGIDPRLHFLHPNKHDIQISNDIHLDDTNQDPLVVSDKGVLPMLASSCPGFVCYVEKTMSNIIPNLCTVKSPMAIAGSMFKHDLLLHRHRHHHQAGDHNGSGNNVDTVDDHIVKKNDNNNIYHVAIMPCHDKKLEAERKDLAWERFVEQEEKIVNDVDLVITTNELFSLLIKTAMGKAGHGEHESSAKNGSKFDEEYKINVVKEYFANLPLAPMKHWTESLDENGVYVSALEKDNTDSTNPTSVDNESIVQTMRGSGSYAEFIFRYASKTLFNHYIPNNEPLPWKSVTRRSGVQSFRKSGHLLHSEALTRRSPVADQSEVTLYRHSDGTYSCSSVANTNGSPNHTAKAVLKFATAYGFKNIQLQMQRISNSNKGVNIDDSNNYHYIETMACPSGCLNGGGQIKQDVLLHSGDLNSKRKEKPSDKRNRVLKGLQFVQNTLPCNCKNEQYVGDIRDDKANMLHTRFHVVPKLELDKGSTAGVSIDDTIW